MDNITIDQIIDIGTLGVWGIIFAVLIIQFIRSIRMVPTQRAFIVERLGKYNKTLNAGFHALLPFLDRVSYIVDLKEESISVPPQECFTKDNVLVEVDGVIYISVTDPINACYGVTDYRIAAIQLAQTTTRSVIGTLDLDRTFEEREVISTRIVNVLTEAGVSWGIKVHRYEIKNIVPPQTVKDAMERQVSAERERRAIIARSEGDKQSRINRSEGLKMELINLSEGERTRRINEAEGLASEIRTIAEATAKSIEQIAAAVETKGGEEAMTFQLSQKYLEQLSSLAKDNVNVLLPTDITQPDRMLAALGLSIPGEGKKKK